MVIVADAPIFLGEGDLFRSQRLPRRLGCRRLSSYLSKEFLSRRSRLSLERAPPVGDNGYLPGGNRTDAGVMNGHSEVH